MLQKYNKLRNEVTSQIRKENINFNNNRVAEAYNESELWKIANEVTNPRKSNGWKVKMGDEEITDELSIAEAFNDYFMPYFPGTCVSYAVRLWNQLPVELKMSLDIVTLP